MKRVLVLGTRNEKKRGELETLLGPLGFVLHSLQHYPSAMEVEETGATFAENAELKATQQAQRLRQWVLGEDSGLCVDALGGAPGVYSARFSGPDATDASNNELLLQRLAQIPSEKRTAHYVCSMALADPQGVISLRSEGRCHGVILHEPRGVAGFGYDPLFLIRECRLTFAELGDSVKSVLSHRARALRDLEPRLRRLLQNGWELAES